MTSSLSRDSLLRRSPAITLELHSAGNATATFEGRSVPLGVHALGILVACTEPVRLGDLAERAGVLGARDFVDFMGSVLELLRQGLLRTADRERAPEDVRGTWSSPAVHVGMLDDETRSAAFIEAIRRTVRPEDVVLDIGCGTGVLSVAAALAGARRVYAIEASSMAEAAADLAKANGVEDRVTVLRGWSSRISIADRATVLVTETIGNDALEEHVMDIVTDAHKRLLAPSARVIPSVVQLRAALVRVPEPALDRLTFTERNTARWTRSYGMDFSPMTRHVPGGPCAVSLDLPRARELVPVTEAFDVGRLDLQSPAVTHAHERSVVVDRDGPVHGALLFFDVEVDAATRFTTEPWACPDTGHWRPTLFLEPRAHEARKGDALKVRLRSVGSSSMLEVGPA